MDGRVTTDILDVIGVGVGPANLSLAALLDPVRGVRARFFDAKAAFSWHPGQLLPGASIQVSFLKDLVTLADPTSRFSFLAYLASKQRLYRFATARFAAVTRLEFDAYFRWVAESLSNLSFGCPVNSVDFVDGHFVVHAGSEHVRACNVVLGTGLAPYTPPCALRALGPDVFHASEVLSRAKSFAGRRVAVIGGGQTGAEIVELLIEASSALPASVVWATRRPNFLPMDDSPFTNELFMPGYSDYFYDLPEAKRAALIDLHELASDGASESTLAGIYRRLYVLEHLEGKGRVVELLPAHELQEVTDVPAGVRISLLDRVSERVSVRDADVVVLATGYQSTFPRYLEPLRGRMSWESSPPIRRDYSLEWDGPRDRRLFAVSGTRARRGLAEPNLSLAARRSSLVINALVGRAVYPVEHGEAAIRWSEAEGIPG